MTTGPAVTGRGWVRIMTATILLTPAVEERTPSSLPTRLVLAPADTAPALIDGAWWPRSRDLNAELPALIEVLDRCGGGSPG